MGPGGLAVSAQPMLLRVRPAQLEPPRRRLAHRNLAITCRSMSCM